MKTNSINLAICVWIVIIFVSCIWYNSGYKDGINAIRTATILNREPLTIRFPDGQYWVEEK
jgi:hypothetical protein